MKTILLISPYWKEDHRWMVSSVKLAELWQRLGYRVVVLCMGKQQQQSGSPDPRNSDTRNLEIHRVPDFFLKDPWNYGIAFGFSGRALRLTREIKPDIVVINKVLFWSSIALLRLRMAGYNVILTTDALVGITWWPRGGIAKVCAAIYAWTLGWLILKMASTVVFFHPQPEQVLKRLGITKKSQVIPTGIDPAFALPRYGGGENVRITYVGRLESVKGVDDFVAAALDVRKHHHELQPCVVGWYKPDHPLVKKFGGDIEFTNLRDDIAKILSLTDIFVLPSYSEGLSNALMEAMSSSCACIATNVGGNAFLIQNGISGLLYDPGDRAALAAHIRRLIEDSAKRTQLGTNARKRIDEVFSWEKVGEQYRKLFDGFSSRS